MAGPAQGQTRLIAAALCGRSLEAGRRDARRTLQMTRQKKGRSRHGSERDSPVTHLEDGGLVGLIDETRALACEAGRPHLQTRVALSREISLPDLSTSQPQFEQLQPP
jgi:hypothetical protein